MSTPSSTILTAKDIRISYLEERIRALEDEKQKLTNALRAFIAQPVGIQYILFQTCTKWVLMIDTR